MPESSIIERLLKAANSSTEGDTSVNLAKRIFLHQSECDAVFDLTRSKVLNIGAWNESSSPTSYELFDEAGTALKSEPIAIGSFIRISLYGSGKYDWVRVLEIHDLPDEYVLTVKPSYDPTERPLDTSSTSHFFGPEATNNFCIQRVEKTLAFYVIGLNEHQNTKFADSLIESARNAAVANIGYYSGLQKAVWKEFCSNMLGAGDEEEES